MSSNIWIRNLRGKKSQINMATRESMVALLEEEDDDHFEERISGRLSFLVEEAAKLELELEKIKGKFETGGNEALPGGSEPNKPMTVQNIDDKLRSAQQKRNCELGMKLVNTPNHSQVKTFDVSSWPYPKLRDVINTSANMDLLLLCHAEVERRVAAKKAEREKMEMDKSAKFIYNRMPIWGQTENASRHLTGWWYFQYDANMKVMRQCKIFDSDLEELSRIAGGPWQVKVDHCEISSQDFESAWAHSQQKLSSSRQENH